MFGFIPAADYMNQVYEFGNTSVQVRVSNHSGNFHFMLKVNKVSDL